MYTYGTYLVAMSVDLLLHLVTTGTIAAKPKEGRASATDTARSPAYGEEGVLADAHRARLLSDEHAPAEGVVAEAARGAPAIAHAEEHKVWLRQLGQPA